MVDWATVGKVAAVQKVQPHHRVALFDQGFIHCGVGNRTRQGLYVQKQLLGLHPWRAEGFCATAASHRFDQVAVFCAFVVTPVGIAPEEG